MGTVIWLGEGDDGPPETTGFRGLVFKKGEAVEVKDEGILAKASKNRYFKVEGWEPPEVHIDVEPAEGQLVHVAPSETPVAGPVPKPGEPVVPRSESKPTPVPQKAAPEPKVETPKEEAPPTHTWPKI